MTAFLWLGLALAAVLVAMLGLVAWQDDRADAERRRQYRDDDVWRERQRRRPR